VDSKHKRGECSTIFAPSPKRQARAWLPRHGKNVGCRFDITFEAAPGDIERVRRLRNRALELAAWDTG
jgi:hypothetical protein